MKNLKKTIIVFFTMLFACSMLFANGATESTSSDAEQAAPEKQVIKIMHYMGEQTKRDGLDLMLKEFEKTHPNVEFDVEPISSAQYVSVYKMRIFAGDAPDLMFGKPQTLKEFAEAGHFMDLTGEECMENILPMLKDECTVDGKVYGFPLDAQVKGTFYNSKMFEDYGIKVPTTKDEFFEACDAFEANGIYPIIHPYNFIHGVFHELDGYFTTQAALTGNAQVWANSQAGTQKLADVPMVKVALEEFSKMASYRDKGDMAMDQSQCIQNFAAEQRPMYTNGGWIMGDVVAANPDGEFGIFPTPWSNDPSENKLWVGIDDVFLVSATTTKKALVMELLNSFASQESSEIWMNNAKLLSSNKNVSTENADSFIQNIKGFIDEGNFVSKSLVPDYTSEYSTAFRTQLQQFVTLDDADRDVDALIEAIDNEMDSIRE